MAVSLSILGGAGAQFFDDNGDPLSGGKIYTYAAGTTTPLATYTTNSGAVAHTNPIILDAAGRIANSGEIWLTDNASYKFVLKTSTDTLIKTWDNITGLNSNLTASDVAYIPGAGSLFSPPVTVSGALDGLSSGTNGSSYVGFLQAGTGAVARTAQSKMRDVVSVKDFGAIGNGIANDTVAVQAAINAVVARGGGQVYFPAGTYNCNVTVNSAFSVVLVGENDKSAIIGITNNEFAIKFDGLFGRCGLRSLQILGTAKTTHGVYVNSGASFVVEECYFNTCGMGLVFNATIDTRLLNCLFYNNYIGLYYTCRTTAGSPTVTDINGQSYTFSSAGFPQQPGESDLFGCTFNLNNIAVIVDQPNNPYTYNSNIKFHGGLIQSSIVGFLGIDLGVLGPPSSVIGTWVENLNTGSVQFNGTTYSYSDFYVVNGILYVEKTEIISLTVKNTSVLRMKNCVSIASSINKDATASIISEQNIEQASLGYVNYVKSPGVPSGLNSYAIRTCNPSGYSYRYYDQTKASKKLINSDTVSFFGAGSSTNVVDGVLDTRQCKEITLSATSNGPVIFSTPGGSKAGKIYVAFLGLKLVSGNSNVQIFNADAGSPIGTLNMSLSSTWKTYVFFRRANTTSAASPYNVIAPITPTTVIRMSGEYVMEFDNDEQVAEFLDANLFPLI